MLTSSAPAATDSTSKDANRGRGDASIAAPTDDSLKAKQDYLAYLYEKDGVVDIRQIHDSGSGPRAFNFVIVSAGFLKGEGKAFFDTCETLKKSLFSIGAWQRFQGLVNIYAVHLEDESVDRTRVQFSGYKGQVMGCNNEKAIHYANYAANANVTVVIHNSDFATPTCGLWFVGSFNRATAHSPNTLQHELGHCVGGLGDVYTQRGGYYDGSLGNLWEGKNATDQRNKYRSHWHYWIPNTWQGMFGPLKLPQEANVQNVEGAAWAMGFYRAEQECVMRGGGKTYCTICTEVMETEILRNTHFFEEVSPAPGEVVLWKGESKTFKLNALKFLRETPPWMQSKLEIHLNGRLVATSDKGEGSFQFGGQLATPGYHQIGAIMSVQPERVRREYSFLTQSSAWRVKVLPVEKPQLQIQPGAIVDQGQTLRIPIKIIHSRPDLVKLTMKNAPDGATLESGSFLWSANKPGAWRVDFTASIDGHEAVTSSVNIRVKPQVLPALGSVKLADVKPATVFIGEPQTIQLNATSANGDNLLYQISNAPEGMQIDRYTGKITWTPSADDMGPRFLEYSVNNGTERVQGTVLVGAFLKPKPYLNWPGNKYNEEQLASQQVLKEDPILYNRIFELSRMLRSRNKKVYAPTLNELQALYEEVPVSYRESFFLPEFLRHVWTYSEREDILKWLDKVSKQSNSKSAMNLRDQLSAIQRYTAKRLELADQDDARYEAQSRGIIRNWQASKIYSNEGTKAGQLVAFEFEPEKDPKADVGWIKMEAYPNGVLDIRNRLKEANIEGPRDNCAIYLRATITMPKATDAEILIASDDGLKAWVNGKVIQDTPGKCWPDKDVEGVKVRLESGVNHLLMKITNGAGDWMAFARIQAIDKTPLKDMKIGLPN